MCQYKKFRDTLPIIHKMQELPHEETIQPNAIASEQEKEQNKIFGQKCVYISFILSATATISGAYTEMITKFQSLLLAAEIRVNAMCRSPFLQIEQSARSPVLLNELEANERIRRQGLWLMEAATRWGD